MDWLKQEIRSGRFKRTVDLYARMLINGAIDWDVLGNKYRSDQKIPAATVKRLLKQEQVQEIVNDKIVEILADKGINEAYLADKRKEVIDKSIDAGKLDTTLKAIEGFEEMLEMKPKVTKQINTMSETRQITVSTDIDKAITATQKLEQKSSDDSDNMTDTPIDES